MASLTITTDAFEPNGRIPDAFTLDGGNETPRLTVAGVPEGAVELALICHDPDAPMPLGWTHWAVYGLPARDGELDTAAGREGANTWGESRWMGPQPPAGHGDHRYYFWVYALSRPVEGTPDRERFLTEYADAVLAQERVVGTFSA